MIRWLDGITDSMDMSLSKLWELEKEGQGSLACCSPWGHEELDTKSLATEQQQCRRESLRLLLCILYLDLESDSILRKYFMFTLFLVLATVYI